MSHRDSPKLQGILKNDDNAQTAQDGEAVSPSTLLNIRPAPSPREGPKCTYFLPAPTSSSADRTCVRLCFGR